MTVSLLTLIELLDLETLERNMFRGLSRDLGARSVYGGQVVAQALVAAARTVEGRLPHSLHAYFLRAGEVQRPIIYTVDRDRDGGTFSARTVRAIQHGEPILTLMASFSRGETGLEHQFEMPQVPPPEELRPVDEIRQRWLAEAGDRMTERMRNMLTREFPMEIRPVDVISPVQPRAAEPRQSLWFRSSVPVADDQLLHRAILAYASDYGLLLTAMLPHARMLGMGDRVVASIDHAVWFYRDVHVDDWLLYTMDSPSAQASRGFARGLVFDRSGRLVASTAQEGLMRDVSPSKP